MEYFDTDQITAQSVAVEDYYSRFSGPEIDARLAEVMPHVQNSAIHITSAERTAWNGKQPSISDLATIRSGAALGATAVQPATLNAHTNNTTMHITAAERTRWNGKQDAITDLATIRSGAALGATAVQPSTLAGYATKATTLAGYGITDALQFTKSDNDEYVRTYFRNPDLNVLAREKYIEWYAGGWMNMKMGNLTINGTLNINGGEISYNADSGVFNIPGYATQAWVAQNAAAKNHRHSELYIPDTTTAYMAVNIKNKTVDFLWNVRNEYNATFHSKDDMYWMLSDQEILRVTPYGVLVKYGNSTQNLIRSLAFKDSLAFSDLTSHPTTLSEYGITDAMRFRNYNNEYVGTSFTNPDLNVLAREKFIEWYAGGWMNMSMGNTHVNGTLRIGNAMLSYDAINNAIKVSSLNGGTAHFYATGDVAAFSALGTGEFTALESLELTDMLKANRVSVNYVLTDHIFLPDTEIYTQEDPETGDYEIVIDNRNKIQFTGTVHAPYVNSEVLSINGNIITEISAATSGTSNYIYMRIGNQRYRITATKVS